MGESRNAGLIEPLCGGNAGTLQRLATRSAIDYETNEHEIPNPTKSQKADMDYTLIVNSFIKYAKLLTAQNSSVLIYSFGCYPHPIPASSSRRGKPSSAPTN